MRSAAWISPGRIAHGWLRRCILNTASSGRFSSDRTIREYGRDIWFRDTAPPDAGGDNHQ
jgi:glucan phosphorylase